jgi:hypothetical protein
VLVNVESAPLMQHSLLFDDSKDGSAMRVASDTLPMRCVSPVQHDATQAPPVVPNSGAVPHAYRDTLWLVQRVRGCPLKNIGTIN